MTKKQMAMALAALLTALAGVLSQCPEDAPPASGQAPDAGAP